MVKFSPSAIVLLSAFVARAKASIDESESSNDNDPFDVEIDIDYSGLSDCIYELTFSFKHNEDLPLPPSDADCNPSAVPLSIAEDGLPYVASRPNYYPFSQSIYEETGFAGHSLDFESCGHPPVGAFTTSHYDCHFYRDHLEVRQTRTCAQPPGAPICITDVNEQTTASGKAFFNVATVYGSDVVANMPEEFTCDVNAIVPAMGLHCWDFGTNPDALSWEEPVLVMGSYDGTIAFFEPMAPLGFVTGDDSNSHMEEVEYQGQTVKTLPEKYSVDYDPGTGRTTIVFTGIRSSCEELFD
ncbi:hypothetical protein ACHAXR_009973 [Thalassiosira sp. AJA248-18]